jgi:anti-anti-sigma factor
MDIETEELGNGITRIILSGKMDITGVQDVDIKFTALTATKKGGFIVDLSQVVFLASIGIRTLLLNAKAAGRRGGKMVLFNPQPLVENVLKTSGIGPLIPIFSDLDAARGALRDSGL